MSATVLNQKDHLVTNKWLLGWGMINERESNKIVEFGNQRAHEYPSIYISEGERERETELRF